MKRAVVSTFVLAAVGCQVAPIAPVGGGGASPRPAVPASRPSPPASPLATLAPSSRPKASPAGTPASPIVAASPAAQPLASKVLPTRITPTLPPALRAAAGLIGADGGSMVAAGAGNLVAAGGLNYALRQAAAPSLTDLIRGQLQIFLVTSMVTEGILLGAAAASLQPGATLTVRDDGNEELTEAEKDDPANRLTIRLVPAGDHQRVEVFRGPTADPARQLAGVSFTSPTRGRALLRDLAPKKDGSQHWISTTFDLDAGTSTADVYSQGPGLARARLRAIFTALPAAAAGAPTFTVRTTAFGKDPVKKDDGVICISANFRDEGAAAVVGLLPTEFKDFLAGNLVFLPADGSQPNPANTAPHAFFLDAAGKDLATAAAPAALKAVVPADADVQKPFMADPTQPKDGAPLEEAVFQFPE